MRALLLAAAAAVGALAPASAQAATADGREYELVSPPDKRGGSIAFQATTQAAPSGDRVAFMSTNAFAGALGSAFLNTYVAERSPNGWATTAVDPPALVSSNLYTQGTVAFSADLSKALQASRVALAPGAVQGDGNVYLRDHAGGGRELVATGPGGLWGSFTGFGQTPFGGATSDFSHVVFETNESLDPDAADGTTHVYEWTGGDLRLVSRMPDGTASPAGGEIGGVPNARPVSADGSRIFFTAGFFGPLFMREDGTDTVALSETRRTDGNPPTLEPAEFGGASRDGSVVYFTSNFLLDESGANTLYRYDVDDDELTDLASAATSPDSPDVRVVLAVSEDGEAVYFNSGAVLAPGATPPPVFGTNLYVWRDGQIRFIAQASDESIPSNTYLSPNGRYFAISGFSPLTPDDVPSSRCPTDPIFNNPDTFCRDVFLYDYQEDSLTCVTCDPNGSPQGHSNLGGSVFNPNLTDHRGRSVLDDGSVFIETPNVLDDDGDSNGRGDVYRWRAGQATLISTGDSDEPSYFGDATADGRSAFIITSERLVPIDVDNSFDVYDARVGGGIPAQHPPTQPAPCADDDCQGPPGADPGGPSPGTQGTGAEPPPPPRADLRLPRSRTVGRGGRIAVRVRLSRAAAVSVRAFARIGNRTRPVASGGARARRAGTVTVRLRLSAAARRRLARRGALPLTLVAYLNGGAQADRARLTVRERSSR
jgi:hypothetical protein